MEPTVVIVPYRDGPYLIRGPAVLRDQDGREIVLRRRTIALCRCGKSRMRPFCDGTHQLIRFSAPSAPEGLAAPSVPEDPDAPCPGEDRDLAPISGGGRAAPRARAKAPSPASGPSGDSAGRTGLDGSSLAAHQLGQVERRLGALLQNGPRLAGAHLALREAEPLVEAAARLLEQGGSTRACLCLIAGALRALSPPACVADAGARELVTQLAHVADWLSPEPVR